MSREGPNDGGDVHLEVQHVTKRFGDVEALNDVCLQALRGEITVVIGGSGSGKTTLVRIMIGLDRPTSGSVCIDGRNLAGLNRKKLLHLRRRIGMVFQRPSLLDSMTIFDNIALPVREHTKLKENEVADKVHEVLEALELRGVEDKLPDELSGGMQKRVELARALIREPEIIAYDEPSSGLDPVTARMVDDLILQTRERFGVTSIVISHDMVEARMIGDRLYVLDEGRIVDEGSPEELMRGQGLARKMFDASAGEFEHHQHPDLGGSEHPAQR